MDPFCYLCFTFALLYRLVCSLQPCDHLLGRADLLALFCMVFPCVFFHFTLWCLGSGVYLLVSIPDLCLLLYVHVLKVNQKLAMLTR